MSPFETNFDFSSWENSKLLKWLGTSLIAIIFEDVQLRKKQKKNCKKIDSNIVISSLNPTDFLKNNNSLL
ncbi:MAG: hypothetical protein CBB92_03950 [Flammeovirgaceae bacterium TMED32]|nr:MAG: hypothetical protein CBB92_03950 [Flammeovirgaceae bacterium TMED32]